MADPTITPASVVAGSNAVKKSVKAGGTVAAGQLVYKAANGLYLIMDSDSATPEARIPAGFALNSASLNQPLQIQTGGDITLGAVLTAATVYVASDTPGGIMPVADLEAGDYVSVVGVAISTSVLRMGIIVSGVAG